ncbi:MAG: metal-sensing transcriptional repressor [Sarcina sp.]
MTEERKKAIQCLKTARGQIDGILKMIDDDRYCIDISYQIMAAQALLKKSNKSILASHLQSCVKDALLSEEGKDEKIEELIKVLGTLIDK